MLWSGTQEREYTDTTVVPRLQLARALAAAVRRPGAALILLVLAMSRAASLDAQVTTTPAGQVRDSATQAPARDTVARSACDAFLATGADDTVPVVVGMRIQPADSRATLPPWYARVLADGMRLELQLPAPLILHTYAPASYTALLRALAARATDPVYSTAKAPPELIEPELFGMYEVRLTRDGHLRDPRVSGGLRDAGFDAAVLRAMVDLDATGQLPPLPDSVRTGSEGLALHILLRGGLRADSTDTASVLPFLLLRVPRYRVTQRVRPLPTNTPPDYPPAMRQNRQNGEVLLQFVVTREGRVDLNTVTVLRESDPAFTHTVIAFLPAIRLEPAMVGDRCAVPILARMPFTFNVEP